MKYILLNNVHNGNFYIYNIPLSFERFIILYNLLCLKYLRTKSFEKMLFMVTLVSSTESLTDESR